MNQDQLALDALVESFFSAFDNRTRAVVEASSFTDLFGPSAVIVTHVGHAPQVATPADFFAPRAARLTSGELEDFHEWETDSQTEIHGSLAVRRSRYAKQGQLRSKPYAGAGTKFFHFAKLTQGWRIMSVSWIDDPAPQPADET